MKMGSENRMLERLGSFKSVGVMSHENVAIDIDDSSTEME